MDSPNRKLILAAAFALIISLALILGSFRCSRGLSDEDRIRRAVADMETAAEKKDLKGFMKYISPRYKDGQGNAQEEIRQLLIYNFFQHDKLSVIIKDLKIEISGKKAKVLVSAILTAGEAQIKSPQDLMPRNMDVYEFNVVFEKTQEDWQVASASWESEIYRNQ